MSTEAMDWWKEKCEHCGAVFSSGWAHMCRDEKGQPMLRDGMGKLRPELTK
jgi:hypothetical protein